MNARRNIPVADLEAHFCDELIVFMRDAEQRLATRANPAIAEKQEPLLNASVSIKEVEQKLARLDELYIDRKIALDHFGNRKGILSGRQCAASAKDCLGRSAAFD